VNGTIDFNDGPFNANVQARYIAAGQMDVTLVGPTDQGYDTDLPNSISDNHIEAMVYIDIGASYRLPINDRGEIEVYAAVKNLLDPTPPVNVYSGSGTNPLLFDTVGRRYVVGVRFSY
jgi:outer membrane receptor protein involved in Fe transport